MNQKNLPQPSPSPYFPKKKMGLSFMSLLRGGLTLNQMVEAWKVNQGRKKAHYEAARMQSLIDEGVTSGLLQNASLGTLEDARRMGLTEPFSGVYLGYLDGVPLFLPNDFHVSTCALAGSGKSVTLSIPNCIATAQAGESLIAFDLKDAEMAKATAKGRHAIDGVRPAIIDPWREYGANCYINFLSDLIDKAQAGFSIVDDAMAKAHMIFGSSDKDGSNAWIRKDAIKLAQILLIEWATNDPERCTPGSFWDFGTLSHEDVKIELTALSKSDAGDGFVSMMAAKFSSQYCHGWSEQFEWVHDSFQKGFALFGRGSCLRLATSQTTIDIALLKQRPQALYIIIPDKYADSHGMYIALLLDYVISTLAEAKGNIRTTIIADEFANYPYATSTVKALRLYRSKLIRLWTFVQDRNGYSKYKDDGGHQVFEENSVSLVWGVGGDYAKEISEKAGYKSVIVQGRNASKGIMADTGGIGSNEQITPVLPVSQISQNFRGKAILDAREKIFVINRIPYWECDLFQDSVEQVEPDYSPLKRR